MVSKGRGRLVRMVVTRYEWWSLGTRRDNGGHRVIIGGEGMTSGIGQ